jgi:rhodanese-related sulfurtransferase
VRLAEIVGKTQEIVIYSKRGGTRGAAESVSRAVTWGYEKVYFFRDGFGSWKAAGYPVESGKQK